MTQHDLGDGVILHSRDEWAIGGRQVHGDPGSRAVSSIDEFIVHHSGGVMLGDPDPFQWARNIYDYHVNVRGYAAEAYEAFVAEHEGRAVILEGRPIGLVSAATYGHNVHGYAAVYMRANNDPDRDFVVPELVKVAFRKLAQVIAFTVGHALKGTDHHDCSGNATECAGQDLNSWVQSGGLWVPFGGQKPLRAPPSPRPRPVPVPAPPAPHLPAWPAWPGVVLKQGSRGNVVALWQSRLHALGARQVVADGVFGPVTDATTRFFQGSKGLLADGAVGPLTWRAAG